MQATTNPTSSSELQARTVPRSDPRNILCVGPDPEWQKDVGESLGLGPVAISGVSRGDEALRAAEATRPELVILDMLLPDMTGLGLCRILRDHPDLSDVPVMMVSSHASEVDRILAFELGVDDFLPAPFFARELASRVHAVIRRSNDEPRCRDTSPRRFGELVFDPEFKRVSAQGRILDVTRTEFEILSLLIRQGGRVLSRRQILGQLSGEAGHASERTVDAHVKSIRRKLGEARDLIETVRGSGYRFASPGPVSES